MEIKMLGKTTVISDKGQIVIPKNIVDRLGSKVVRVELVNNNEVRIIPIKDVGGSLKNYAKKINLADFQDIREKARIKALKEKFMSD
jgi:AbrB family looped-hinge helix DNA binding protein